MSVRYVLISFMAVVLLAPALSAATVVGPAKGSLVIVGGNIQDLSILRRFIDLAGGPDVPIVVIPTAGGAPDYDQYWSGLKIFRDAGAKNLTVTEVMTEVRRALAREEVLV